jgi:hypothetical protein
MARTGMTPRARNEMQSALRAWINADRSDVADSAYLESVRSVFEWWLPTWTRWKPFGRVIGLLGDTVRDIAWTNFAKCRVPEQRSKTYRNPSKVVNYCQGDYPISEVVEAIRPVAVLTCVKNAYEGGGIVRAWRTANAAPVVFTWHGLHGTDRVGRRIGVWSQDAAEVVRARRTSGA